MPSLVPGAASPERDPGDRGDGDLAAPAEAGRRPTFDELRRAAVFTDQDDAVLAWIAERTDVVRAAAGAVLTRPGDPADWMFVQLAGEVRVRRESPGATAPVFVMRPGTVWGALPFSRMTRWPAASRAVVASEVARFPRAARPYPFLPSIP